MDSIKEFLAPLFGILVLVIIWFVIRRMLRSISDKINNSEVYKEDTLRVLEEIRDELKQLNQKEASK